jgi:acetyl-CoA carboxylase, biotin carboxylase subunit
MHSVLIANRGEIAVRVVRACRELGLRSVAVYSEADRGAPHVLMADEAYLLGPAPSTESYLRVDRILDAAHRAGVDAIHPGYGFLAERAPFARAVEAAGLVFVGPAPGTIESMGDKTEARRRMAEAGVPIVPGTTEPLADAEEAETVARGMGFPVLLKASAGGGGKGMRVVEGPEGIRRAFEAASREAAAAFGDGAVYVEKYLERPRHIEIQLLGDRHGTVVHLGERECSIQRRHQKLVEEAPSPVLDPETRAAMGDAAVRAAQAVDYEGAGTVEFLWQDGEFHFLEMNTRIQVEHPVTELVTGIDLVQWQLRIAAGDRLPWSQEEIAFQGHAIECRITSEDPDEGFLPSTGRIRHLEVPGGPGVRWDGGIARGGEVGLHYDPLLGKLIVHAPTRDEAVRRMARALEEFVLEGVETCAPFHRRVMAEPHFGGGDVSIRYLEEHPALTRSQESDGDDRRAAAAIAALLEDEHRRSLRPPRIAGGNGGLPLTPWVGAFRTSDRDG